MLKVVDVIGLASTGAYEGDASLVTRTKIVRIARLGFGALPQGGPCRHRVQHAVRRGAAVPTPKPSRDETLVKALVRAHRWRRKIESGQAKSITDLAEQEGVTDAYVCRLLPLTCLAPDIVEAIIDGRQPKGLRLAEMLGLVTSGWDEQRVNWSFGSLGKGT
jgi:hypothetical protein